MNICKIIKYVIQMSQPQYFKDKDKKDHLIDILSSKIEKLLREKKRVNIQLVEKYNNLIK